MAAIFYGVQYLVFSSLPNLHKGINSVKPPSLIHRSQPTGGYPWRLGLPAMFSSHKANMLNTLIFPGDQTSCHSNAVSFVSLPPRADGRSMLSGNCCSIFFALTAAWSGPLE